MWLKSERTAVHPGAPVTAASAARMPTSTDHADNCIRQWLEQRERLRFTVAGICVGIISFRCITLVQPIGQPPYPVTRSLINLLPKGFRAVRLPSQPITAELPRISRRAAGICYVAVQGKRFFIDLGGSYENYLKKFSNKTRSTMRRKIRKLSETCGGSVGWKEFRYPMEMAEFRRLATEVSAKTYQHRQLRAGIDASPIYWAEIARCATADCIRGYILFNRETPIAYSLCRAFGDNLVSEILGFDPTYAAYSPGTALLHLMLQRLFGNNRFKRFDLGPGEYSYKENLATGSLDTADLYWFPWNVRNILLIGAHGGIEAAQDWLKSVLTFLGLKEALKKRVRRW